MLLTKTHSRRYIGTYRTKHQHVATLVRKCVASSKSNRIPSVATCWSWPFNPPARDRQWRISRSLRMILLANMTHHLFPVGTLFSVQSTVEFGRLSRNQTLTRGLEGPYAIRYTNSPLHTPQPSGRGLSRTGVNLSVMKINAKKPIKPTFISLRVKPRHSGRGD